MLQGEKRGFPNWAREAFMKDLKAALKPRLPCNTFCCIVKYLQVVRTRPVNSCEMNTAWKGRVQAEPYFSHSHVSKKGFSRSSVGRNFLLQGFWFSWSFPREGRDLILRKLHHPLDLAKQLVLPSTNCCHLIDPGRSFFSSFNFSINVQGEMW